MPDLLKTAASCWGVAVFLSLATLTCLGANDPLLVGKEVEVGVEHLVHLLPYFDFTGIRVPGPDGDVPPAYLADPRHHPAPNEITRREWNEAMAFAMIREGEKLKLRADCPPEIKSILEKMNWSQDGGRLEFRDTTPFSNIDQYVDHTNRFLKLVKMDQIENEPLKNLGKTYFHFHLSVKNGRDHRAVVERLNALAALKFIEGGKGKMLVTDAFGFVNVDSKGLLRLHSPERVEIRNHFISPEGDLRELYRLLTQPEAESRTELSREIRKRLTPEAIQLLAVHRADLLVQMIDHTNLDLPDRLSLTSQVESALEKGIVAPEADLFQFHDLLKRLYARSGTDPEAKSLAHRLALKLQDRACEDPHAFYEKTRFQYGQLLASLHDMIPPDERKYSPDERRWLAPLDLNSLLGAGVLADLVSRNRWARQAAVRELRDPRFARQFISSLSLEALTDPTLRAGVLEAIPSIPDIHYESFLHRIAARSPSRLSRDFLPFLERGITARLPLAAELKALVHDGPDCRAAGKL